MVTNDRVNVLSTGGSLARAILTWALLPTTLAGAWDVRLPAAAGAAPPIAVDRTGNVLVALFVRGAPRAVRKLDEGDGSPVWHRMLDEDRVGAIAVSSTGRIFVGGRGVDDGGLSGMLVARLSRADGHTKWRRVLTGLSDRGIDWVYALAADTHGDVVAAGTRAVKPLALLTGYEFTVVKLAGDTGFPRWRFRSPSSDEAMDAANTVVVDTNDDVITAGTTSASAHGHRVTVLKLRGADGETLWRRDIDIAASARFVAADAAGDLFVASRTERDTGADFGVFKLSGATGEMLWEFRLSRSTTNWEEALQVIALPSGDAVALGITTGQRGKGALTTVRLDGRTGRVRWRRLMRGGPGYGGGPGLVALPEGDLVVGGQTRCRHIELARLSAATGHLFGRLRMEGTSASGCGRHPDELGGVVADRRGRVVVAGSFSDQFRHGTGFVTRLERLP